MRFEAERKELLNRINRWRSWNLFNEEATILGVVLPIIKLMGYDISNPEEVLPQSPDRNRNRPDLKLYQMSALDNGEVKHVIEVKALSKNELANSTSQIGSYFVGNSAQWYVLTNGYEWKIYDSNSPHTKPRYFRINIILDTVGAIDALYHILGKDVDTPDIESAAEKIVKGRLETAARKIFWSDHRTVWEGAAQLHKSLLQDVEKLKKEFASHEDMIEQWRQDFEQAVKEGKQPGFFNEDAPNGAIPSPDFVSIRNLLEGEVVIRNSAPTVLRIGEKEDRVSQWKEVLLNVIKYLDKIGSLPPPPFPSKRRGRLYDSHRGNLRGAEAVLRSNGEQIFVQTHSSTESKIISIRDLLQSQTDRSISPETVYVMLRK